MWHVYVVRCADRSLYTGVTTDVARRVREHNGSVRGARYTRSRRPVVLVYVEEHPSRSDAQKREHAFKKLGRTEKERKILHRVLTALPQGASLVSSEGT